MISSAVTIMPMVAMAVDMTIMAMVIMNYKVGSVGVGDGAVVLFGGCDMWRHL